MRTTLTLDPDVARMVQEEVHRVRKPFKDVVNDALRRGLTSSGLAGPGSAIGCDPIRHGCLPASTVAGSTLSPMS
jgi:hypothetical protein